MHQAGGGRHRSSRGGHTTLRATRCATARTTADACGSSGGSSGGGGGGCYGGGFRHGCGGCGGGRAQVSWFTSLAMRLSSVVHDVLFVIGQQLRHRH